MENTVPPLHFYNYRILAIFTWVASGVFIVGALLLSAGFWSEGNLMRIFGGILAIFGALGIGFGVWQLVTCQPYLEITGGWHTGTTIRECAISVERDHSERTC